MKKEFRILAWRAPYDIATCWIVIAACIFLVAKISWWLFPLTAIITANRLLALSLLCHEGLHGNLSPNKNWNDFMGRYLCGFPCCISFSKYRRLHILHHSGIGSEHWDPDRHLYNYFPMNARSFLKQQVWNLVTLKTAWNFIKYYTEIPELIQILRGKLKLRSLHKASDLKSFLIFIVALNSTLIFLGVWGLTQIFWFFPLMFITQPYVLLMGGLQHGPVRAKNDKLGPSRTVHGSKLYMWLLLPLDINFHAEHHYNPSVPHYWLKAYSAKLSSNNFHLWKESYRESLFNLFSQKTISLQPAVSVNSKDDVHLNNSEFLPQFESPSAAKTTTT